MKRCPTCSRVFDDDNLRFCLDDGTNLVDRSPTEPVPTTMVLPPTAQPVPTMKQAAPPDVPSLHDARPRSTVAAAPRKRNVLLWIIIIALLVPFVVGAVIGGFVIFKKRALTWHLVLELGPTTNREAAVKQTVGIIENRLDAMGVSRFEVKPESEGTSGRILINLPTVTDPDRLKQIITTGGKLELVHVISLPNPSPVQTYSTKEQAIASLNSSGRILPTFQVLPYVERAETSTNPATKWVVVKSPAIIAGGDLRNAWAVPAASGDEYEITFSLSPLGADKFGTWTGANISEYMGVVLNDEVKSIAYIRSQISDQGVINGRFTKQSAEDLALVLRSGALPTPIKIVDERVDR